MVSVEVNGKLYTVNKNRMVLECVGNDLGAYNIASNSVADMVHRTLRDYYRCAQCARTNVPCPHPPSHSFPESPRWA